MLSVKVVGDIMKKSIKVLLPVLVSLLLLGSGNAIAKRMGGGKSLGRQSSNVTQGERAATAPNAAGEQTVRAGQRSNAGPEGANTVAPAPGAAPAATGGQSGAAAPSRRPWGGALVTGLAAGLGFAWLASTMGFSDASGNMLLVALLMAGFVWLWLRAVRMRRQAAMAHARTDFPLAFQGASQRAMVPRAPYRPENVGNDASARPFEQAIPVAVAGTPAWQVPEGFDTAGFLAAAQSNFVTLQAAWDRADIPALRSMMTDSMLGEIRTQLAEREALGEAPAPANTTEVVMIDARLLGIETLPNEYLASVEFSGMIREEPSAGPNPFREVWNMSKPRNGQTGWLVAGVQALQ